MLKAIFMVDDDHDDRAVFDVHRGTMTLGTRAT
jgi:hypothetical protein